MLRPIHNLTGEEVLQLQQLVAHPSFPALNKLLLFQVESETADFVSRDLIDAEEIVNRYKDLRGVHKAVGNVLTVLKKLTEPEIENKEPESGENPLYFPQQ